MSKSFTAAVTKIYNTKEIAESTKTAYISGLRTVAEGVTPGTKSIVFLKDTEKVKTFINNHYTENGRRNIYGSIVTLLDGRRGYTKAVVDYKKHLNTFMIINNIKAKDNKVPEKMKGKLDGELEWVKLGDKIVKELKKKLKVAKKGKVFRDIFEVYELLVLALLTFKSGFIERLSYRTFKIITNTDDKNEDLNQIKGNTMWFNVGFKNVNSIGKQVRKLPAPVSKVIKDYINFKNNKDFLFFSEKLKDPSKHKEYTSKEFTKLVPKMIMFGEVDTRLTMNDLRKLQTNHIMDSEKYRNMSGADQNKYLIQTGFHQKAISESVYRMVDN